MRLSAEAARRGAMEPSRMKVRREIEICERHRIRRSFMGEEYLPTGAAHSRKCGRSGWQPPEHDRKSQIGNCMSVEKEAAKHR